MRPWKSRRQRARSADGTRFNEATAVRPWKDALLDGRPRKCTGFNEATAVRPWKDRRTTATAGWLPLQ